MTDMRNPRRHQQDLQEHALLFAQYKRRGRYVGSEYRRLRRVLRRLARSGVLVPCPAPEAQP